MSFITETILIAVLIMWRILPTYAQETSWRKLVEQAIQLNAQLHNTEAIEIAEKALRAAEAELGPAHPDVAVVLNSLGQLYTRKVDLVQAESYYKRALAIWKIALGPAHPDVAVALNNLAFVLAQQGNYTAAQPLYEEALQIKKRVFGPNHPDTAISLNNLAFVLAQQGNYTAAQPLYEEALKIKKRLNPKDPTIVTSLSNLGRLHYDLGLYVEAKKNYSQALALVKASSNLEGEQSVLNNLGAVSEAMGDYVEARKSYQQALAISRQVGNRQAEALILANLEKVTQTQGRTKLAKAQLTGAAEIAGPGDNASSGTVQVTLNSDKNEVCYDLSLKKLDDATAAHIREGAAGKEGPIKVSFDVPKDGSAKGCKTADAAVVKDIMANPANYYVNVPNPAHPKGAIRGQLSK
jgi:tetratricopeptide (TPR) repeat protein